MHQPATAGVGAAMAVNIGKAKAKAKISFIFRLFISGQHHHIDRVRPGQHRGNRTGSFQNARPDFPLLCSFAPRAGLVALRQTSVRRRQLDAASRFGRGSLLYLKKRPQAVRHRALSELPIRRRQPIPASCFPQAGWEPCRIGRPRNYSRNAMGWRPSASAKRALKSTSPAFASPGPRTAARWCGPHYFSQATCSSGSSCNGIRRGGRQES